jgi:O-antigen ligase/polysaccharide polymerase Wzy-like membrane protein
VALADGGLYPRTWRLATLALCAIAAAGLLLRDRSAFGRMEWGVLVALTALACWTVVSSVWSSNAAVSRLQAERVLPYVAAVLAVLVVAELPQVPYLLAGVVAGITIASGYGLARYVFWPPPLDPFEGNLLYQPFGYANALGIYAAVGILVALGLALWSGRVLFLIPIGVLAPTLYYTAARGAWLALGVGLAWLVWFGTRISPRTAALLAVPAVAAAVLALIRLAGDNRVDYWRVALQDYRIHPLLGAGAGTYGDYWLAHGPGTSFTRTAHSLYLQALAELGPVGLALVVLALAPPLVVARRRGDGLAGAAAAGYVAYVVHTGLDWDWEMPAATLAGLFCGGAALVTARGADLRPVGPGTRAALLAFAVALAGLALFRLHSGARYPFGS